MAPEPSNNWCHFPQSESRRAATGLTRAQTREAQGRDEAGGHDLVNGDGQFQMPAFTDELAVQLDQASTRLARARAWTPPAPRAPCGPM
jgi:hypothetical protein